MLSRTLLTTLLLGLCFSCYSARSGEQLATFQKTNGTFAIRTTVMSEKTLLGGPFLKGAYYIFETKTQNEGTWREVLVFRHDNPEPINEDRIHFVNDRIALVYIGWKYAVTTDAGEKWSVWNGTEYPFQQGRMGYNGIQGVGLFENGVGTMRVKLIGNDELTELHTKDFGVNWFVDRNIQTAK